MSERILNLKASDIYADPDQPRRHFDEEQLRLLAVSIKTGGLLHPVVVRPHPTKRGWMIIAGERRWRSHAIAKMDRVRCIVKRPRNSNELKNLQAAENMARSDMTPSEEARHIDRQVKAGQTYATLARVLGKTPTTLKDIHLLLTLPAPLLKEVDEDRFAVQTAKQIAKALPERLHVQAYEKTKGKSIAEAKAVLMAMELEHRQVTVFKFTADDVKEGRRQRALTNLDAFKAAAHALFASAPDELSNWITRQPGHFDFLQRTEKRIADLVRSIETRKARGVKTWARSEPSKGGGSNEVAVRPAATLTPGQLAARKAWDTRRARAPAQAPA